MRLDMGKCVIERPRHRSQTAMSAKARYYGKIVHYDDGPEYEGLTRLPESRKQEGYHSKLGHKEFSDLLGPLNRYLRTNCGRPWNDVYSEIKQTLGKAPWSVQHILSAHLDVAVHTYRGEDGNVWICDQHGIHKVGGQYYDFHVEPETGVLRESTRYRKKSVEQRMSKPRPVEAIPIAEGSEYRRIKGIWYYHEFIKVEVQTPVFLRGSFYRTEITIEIVSQSKRQLGRKELKRLGLRNDSWRSPSQVLCKPDLYLNKLGSHLSFCRP